MKTILAITWIDWLVVHAYLATITAVGTWAYRGVKHAAPARYSLTQ